MLNLGRDGLMGRMRRREVVVVVRVRKMIGRLVGMAEVVMLSLGGRRGKRGSRWGWSLVGSLIGTRRWLLTTTTTKIFRSIDFLRRRSFRWGLPSWNRRAIHPPFFHRFVEALSSWLPASIRRVPSRWTGYFSSEDDGRGSMDESLGGEAWSEGYGGGGRTTAGLFSSGPRQPGYIDAFEAFLCAADAVGLTVALKKKEMKTRERSFQQRRRRERLPPRRVTNFVFFRQGNSPWTSSFDKLDRPKE